MKYRDVVEYNYTKLFSGAIDIDCFLDNPIRAKEISSCYIFHGKNYHAGNSDSDHYSHVLTDTIAFTEKVVDALASNNPEMLLAIAGYGVGKSHLALTLSSLFSSRDAAEKNQIISKIRNIDYSAAERIEESLGMDEKPFLVVPINGMRNVNLKDLFFSTIKRILVRDHIDTRNLDSFDPRFAALKDFLMNRNDKQSIEHVLEDCAMDMKDFEVGMDSLDNYTYDKVCSAIKKEGLNFYPPAAICELKEVISQTALSYCGYDKPYRAMLIIFDEFGKYMAFSAANEAVAGPGCMQLLFEGVNSPSGDAHVVLLGLSQLDLKEYQRSSGDVAFLNNMSRYVTRFDTAKRYYLSACFETLVANLILVNNKQYLPSFEKNEIAARYYSIQANMTRTFKAIAQNNTWSTSSSFLDMVCKGCWPLSPYLVWTLAYISSANNILQQRSSFNILANLFSNIVYDEEFEIGKDTTIPAVSLFQAGLAQELVESERVSTTANPIATEYSLFVEKYMNKLQTNDVKVLQAIVLAQKLSASCETQSMLDSLLVALTGLTKREVFDSLSLLQEVFNAVSYNSNSLLYEIRSDSVSVAEFSKVIKRYVEHFESSESPEVQFQTVKSLLLYDPDFESLKDEYFNDVFCDFALDNDISTPEWNYSRNVIVGYNYLELIDEYINILKIQSAVNYFDLKGKMFYVVLPSQIALSEAKKRISALLSEKNRQAGYCLPVMLLVISDGQNEICNSAIELSVMARLTKDESLKYSSLIPRRREMLIKSIKNAIDRECQEKKYIYPITLRPMPLKLAGSKIFEYSYPEVIPFFVDGKSWLGTVENFISLLSSGSVSWNEVNNKLIIQDRNRAQHLFIYLWKAYDKKGNLLRIPGFEPLKNVFEKIDSEIENGCDVSLYSVYEHLICPPYGANSTAATLIVFLFLASRWEGLDFFNGNDLIVLSDYVGQKNTYFEKRTKALVYSKWKDVLMRKAIRDDAKWFNLINTWTNSNDLLELISIKKQAEELSANKVSVPPTKAIVLGECIARSDAAYNLYEQWCINKGNVEKEITDAIGLETFSLTIDKYTKYILLFNQTLGKLKSIEPKVTIPESIMADVEGFEGFVSQYIRDNLSSWLAKHELNYTLQKEEFSKLQEKYKRQILNLRNTGLDDIAIEIEDVLYEQTKKQNDYSFYLKFRNYYSSELAKINNTINNQGLFSSAQVVGIKQQLTVISEKIVSFPPERLKNIDGMNFVELRDKTEGVMASVDKVRNEKEQALEQLYNLDIHKISDVVDALDKMDDLILYYHEFGQTKDNNLEDAQNLKKELTFLQSAYQAFNDADISLSELNNVLEQWKKSASELPDSFFNDVEILEEFSKGFITSIKERSFEWVTSIKKELLMATSVQAVDKIQFEIDKIPAYARGCVDAEIMTIKNDSVVKRSKMRMDYLKHLFLEISDKEKLEFVNWCSTITPVR